MLSEQNKENNKEFSNPQCYSIKRAETILLLK